MAQRTGCASMEWPSHGVCPLPWIHLSLHSDLTFRVCCNATQGREIRNELGHVLKVTDLDDIRQVTHSPFMQRVRQTFLQGGAPPFCRPCLDVESQGGRSFRNALQAQFQERMQAVLARTTAEGVLLGDHPILYFDASIGNSCNLECKMCNPDYSLRVARNWDRLGWKYRGTDEALWSAAMPRLASLVSGLGQCERLSFQGGEPLRDGRHLELLRALVKQGASRSISLEYTTNLTLFPERLLALWMEFKQVGLHVSLEGEPSVNDYIRYPSSFKEVFQNIQRLVSLKKVFPIWVDVSTVFQIYNCFRFGRFLEMLFEYRDQIPAVPAVNLIHDIPHFNPGILPQEMKAQIVSSITTVIEKNRDACARSRFAEVCAVNISRLEVVCRRMLQSEPAPEEVKKFVSHTRSLEQCQGGGCFADLVPEMRGYFSEVE